VDGFLVLRALTDSKGEKEKEYGDGGSGGGACAERVNDEAKEWCSG
jgi:hypothetical protein